MATKPKSKAGTPRTPGGAVPLSRLVKALNRWRDQLNPTAGLTMRHARTLIDAYLRGDFADIMWLFGAPFAGIESSDADLLALIELRTSAIQEMDWQIKIRAPRKNAAGVITRPVGFDQALADEQAAALDEAYDGIDNLQAAIEHLSLAKFRGFSHLEKHTDFDGDVLHLEPVDQWNMVRDGWRGDWKYNPDALSTAFRSLPETNLVVREDWIIRETARPVNRIALTKFVRMNLSQKDWDAFIEIYGLPSGIVIMPPNVPKDDEEEFERAAKEVAEGGSGALPNGSEYKPNDQPRGTNPFHEHLKYLTEQLILAGTGGKLTMLTESGSGTLAGGAHSDTFRTIARADAKQISAEFQRQFDASVLDRHFPARPKLAYFELCFAEETDTGEFVNDVSVLSSAGYQVDPAQVAEKSGYKVTIKPSNPGTVPGFTGPALLNRAKAQDPELESFLAEAQKLIGNARSSDIQPLAAAMEKLLDGPDESFADRLTEFRAVLQDLAPKLLASPRTAAAFESLLSASLFEGLTSKS